MVASDKDKLPDVWPNQDGKIPSYLFVLAHYGASQSLETYWHSTFLKEKLGKEGYRELCDKLGVRFPESGTPEARENLLRFLNADLKDEI